MVESRKKVDPAAKPYQVVARRFRPKTFAEVVGQDEILGSLRKALTSGRIPHAFLFAGGRGVGKTTLARILARCLNCATGPTPEPCGTCAPCRSILEDRNADFVEIDAASHNGVDDIRELREYVGFATMGARYKVYLLDEVHMLSKGAFNAFLKTLEEPPPNVVFVMATTELSKVPDTIRSRCQLLRFSQVGERDIAARLARICAAEGVQVEGAVLADLARASRGGMRDAETMLERILPVAREQVDAFGLEEYRRLFHRVGFEHAREVVSALCVGEAAPALAFVAELAIRGGDEREALGEVLDVLRTLLLFAIDGVDTPLVAYDGDRAGLLAMAQEAGIERLDAMIQAGLVGRERMRDLEDRRLVLEVSLVRMAQAGRLPLLADLAAAAAAGLTVGGTPPAAALRPTPTSGPVGLAAAGGDLGARLQVWLERHKPMLAPTLAHCRVAEPDAHDVVRIAIQTDRKMHRDRLLSDGVQQMLRQGLSELLGREVKIAVAERADSAASAATAAPAGSKPAVSQPPSSQSPSFQPPSSSPAGSPSAGRETGAPAKPAPAEVPDTVRRVAKRFDGRILGSEDPNGP